MKKVMFLLLAMLSVSASAQMTDLLGSLSLQGTITQQSTQSAARGLKAVNELKILQDIQQVAMEIKTTYIGNYSGVNKASVMSHPFSGLDWTVAPLSSARFFIQLNQIDKETCFYLLSSGTGAVKTELNSGSESCSEQNTIKFIFY